MCRWFIYKGNECIDIKTLLLRPNNSIFKQTFKKTYTPYVTQLNPRDHEINVDGFGVCWYDLNKVYSYKNSKPPWNDYNIINLSEYIKSSLVFAHIRAIKPFSGNSIVNDQNCHPFYYLNFTWMHNGDIKNLINLQKYVYQNCDNLIIKNIKGNTDSELLFCIFISQLPEKYRHKKFIPYAILKNTLISTIRLVTKLNNNEVSSLNLAFSDGKTIICSRYINSTSEDPPSLYYTYGNKVSQKGTEFFIEIDNQNIKKIIISSEPINKYSTQWKLIPKNYLLIFTSKNNIKLMKINMDKN